ncbi:MAG: sigma-70 family RNA polymerase sigma factor [Deltaproteobacteria bacterium]|nr:sigma-70 family RNA polymerase sigma factor [Deltaproteobacteria bacterium]
MTQSAQTTLQDPPPSQPPQPGPRASEEELVRLALPLIRRRALHVWRRLGQRVELDELVSLGLMVALRAARRYDPSKAKFSPYLMQRFNWSLMSEMRRQARRRIDVSRGTPCCASPRYAAQQPSAVRCTEGGELSGSPSIFERCGDETTAGKLCTLGDLSELAMSRCEDPEQAAMTRRRAVNLRSAIAELPHRARTLIERHYFRGERFDHVAADLGISKYAASRLHKSAVRAMAKRLQEQGLADE